MDFQASLLPLPSCPSDNELLPALKLILLGDEAVCRLTVRGRAVPLGDERILSWQKCWVAPGMALTICHIFFLNQLKQISNKQTAIQQEIPVNFSACIFLFFLKICMTVSNYWLKVVWKALAERKIVYFYLDTTGVFSYSFTKKTGFDNWHCSCWLTRQWCRDLDASFSKI